MTAKPKRPRGPMNLAQFEAWLKETGQWDAYVERRQQKNDKLAELEAELSAAEEPLVRDLRAAGFDIKSVYDLVNMRGSYPKAVPILFEHLVRPYPQPIKEGIARALCVRDAIVGWALLERLYRAEGNDVVKDALAVALAGAADDSVLDDVIALLRDTSIGPSRVLLLSALDRSKAPKARTSLMSLGEDPQLAVAIQDIFKKHARRKKKG